MESNRVHCLDDNFGFVELVGSSKDPGLSIVKAARCSYGNSAEKFTEKDKGLVNYLWEHNHTSPFRHSFYTFHIKVPLFVLRQWTKYQVGSTWRKYEVDGHPVSVEAFDLFYDEDKGCSWNELSGRYKKLEPDFYVPRKIRGNTGHGSKQSSGDLGWSDTRNDGYRDIFRDRYKKAYIVYKSMLADGVAKELARLILPVAVYTEVYWTVSLQSLIHFLRQRLQPDAQFEIRKCALGIYQLVSEDLSGMGITYEDIVT